MGCIEIKLLCRHLQGREEINRNMGCIEISVNWAYFQAAYGLIETWDVLKLNRSDYDSLYKTD